MHSETEAQIFKRITNLELRSAQQETEIQKQQKTINSLKDEINALKERMTCLKDEHHQTGKLKSFKEVKENAGDRVRRLLAERRRAK